MNICLHESRLNTDSTGSLSGASDHRDHLLSSGPASSPRQVEVSETELNKQTKNSIPLVVYVMYFVTMTKSHRQFCWRADCNFEIKLTAKYLDAVFS